MRWFEDEGISAFKDRPAYDRMIRSLLEENIISFFLIVSFFAYLSFHFSKSQLPPQDIMRFGIFLQEIKKLK